MRIPTAVFLFTFIGLLFSCKSTIKQEVKAGKAKGLMDTAASQFLASLDESQSQEISFPFEVLERFNWHFTPRERAGLAFAKLNEEQRGKLTLLMKSILSEQGYNKARDIMSLELVLRLIEDRPENDTYRDPENYYISIFGSPTDENPWGWRFEGHHLSLNFSSVDNQLSATPSFYGSNPAIVPKGPREGWEALDQEQNLARAFVKSLDASQQTTAIIQDSAPEEIISGVERKVAEMPLEGLAYADMTAIQQESFLELLNVYLGNMKAAYAKLQLAQIKEATFDQLHFAWAGGLEVGDAHYYRIHGPTVLIEYDNIQTEANHIHTVWRDLTNDFGEDLLSKHYRDSKHHH